MTEVLVVGAGVFGLTAALELRGRGHGVTVVDPGPIPHPHAASNDLNKAVRMEYGPDALYRDMADAAIDGWHAWNDRFGEHVYVETGVLLLAGAPMETGGFEFESLRRARQDGHQPEHLAGDAVTERFGAWAPGVYPEALYHRRGGYARGARTVEHLAAWAQASGVVLRPGTSVKQIVEHAGQVAGVVTVAGEVIAADHTVLAAGAWMPELLPELRPRIRPTAHPMFYLRPADPTPYTVPRFCVFTADVARTGWYGFPVDSATGLMKLAKHDAGDAVDPGCDRDAVTPERIDELRAFLRQSLPGLADAPLDHARYCLYTDTLDGHFWIDRHPGRAGLTVATGGSGHALKMAPVLGPLIADAVEGHDHPWADRFRWRTAPSSVPGDAARAAGPAPGSQR